MLFYNLMYFLIGLFFVGVGIGILVILFLVIALLVKKLKEDKSFR